MGSLALCNLLLPVMEVMLLLTGRKCCEVGFVSKNTCGHESLALLSILVAIALALG